MRMGVGRGCGVVAAAALLVTPLYAQLTVGLAGGTVRYENLATINSVSVNPDMLVIGRYFLFDVTANAITATGSTRFLQGGATFWGATPPFARHVQLTGLLQAQGTKPDGGVGSTALQGFGEVALARPGRGIAVGVGGVRGQLQGQPAVNALRTGARAWMSTGMTTFAVAVEPTRFAGSWFTDYGARAQTYQGPLILVGGLTLRQGTGLVTSAGLDAFARWQFPGAVAFEASGGHYLRDPYQGLPAGWYVTAGFRLTLWRPPSSLFASNVSLASLSTVNPASQATTNLGSSGTRTVPGVGSAPTSGSSGNPGRGHHP
jgi:hypothetical protein